MMTIVVSGASCAAVFFAGGLIHTARGKSAGCDRPVTKRSGWALLHEYPVGVGSRVVGRLWP